MRAPPPLTGRSLPNAAAGLETALRRHVEALSVGIGPRGPFDGDALARARHYVRDALAAVGLAIEEHVYDYRGLEVANVIAAAPDHAEARAYYVVGAHYDSVPFSPGADDNASAVAVLIELARRLPGLNLRVPVKLVAFTLEESPAFMTGHQGSRVYLGRRLAAGDRIAGAMVLEMVGYTAPSQRYPPVLRFAGYPASGHFIGVIGNWRSRALGRAVLRGFRANPALPVEKLFVPCNGWVLPATRLSDHAAFWDAGLPALMITDTAFFRNPHYHRASDTVDTLDFGFMAGLVVSLELALKELPPL